MYITGTHFNYYQVCRRKLWLFANGINMEHTSQLVEMGKIIHENSYMKRRDRYQEVELDGIKVDYYDPQQKVIHEIKKSDKLDKAHEWQLKYYIFKTQNAGIEVKFGILEYPKLRKTHEVLLLSSDKETIMKMEKEILQTIQSPECPPTIKKSRCKKCAYYDFCYSGEEEETYTEPL